MLKLVLFLSIHLKFKKLKVIFLSKLLLERRIRYLLERVRKINVAVDGFGQPLLDSHMFVLLPKLLHLISTSFRNASLFFNLHPEGSLVEVVCVVLAHYLEHFDSFYDFKPLGFVSV